MTPKGLDLLFGQLVSFWEPIPPGIGIGALNNFDTISEVRFDPAFPLALVSTIGKEMKLHLRLFLAQLLKELLAAVPVGDMGREDLDTQ